METSAHNNLPRWRDTDTHTLLFFMTSLPVCLFRRLASEFLPFPFPCTYSSTFPSGPVFVPNCSPPSRGIWRDLQGDHLIWQCYSDCCSENYWTWSSMSQTGFLSLEMYFLFYNHRALSGAHGCWMKDHISQPPLSVVMWLSSGQWEVRGDVCKFWDICIKKRKTNPRFLFPFLLVGMSVWWRLLEQSLRWHNGSRVLRMAEETLEAAWGPDPAMPSYLWYKTEKWISLS